MTQLLQAGQPRRIETRTGLLRDAADALRQLRSRLNDGILPATAAELGREIDSLLARIDHDLGQSHEAGARARFEQALALQPAFERVIRTWTDFRANAGIEAAREILADSDTFEGWRDRWGSLADVAWARRSTLESVAPSGWARPRVTEAGSVRRQRLDRFDQVLALDLRYAAAMPLAQIGELLNLSPAAVQIRLSEFEDSVLEAAAVEVIQRQVPEGWRLTPAGSERRSDELVLSRHQGQSKTEIALRVVPIWADRETSLGRRRSTNRPIATRLPRRRFRIWVVVFADGPRVRFLPDSRLQSRTPAGEMTVPELVEVAQELGMDVLADAVREASNTEGGQGA